MPTHAEIAAKLLRDAAVFFRTMAEHNENEDFQSQMQENADVFEKVATLVESDPSGQLEGQEQPAEEDNQ